MNKYFGMKIEKYYQGKTEIEILVKKLKGKIKKQQKLNEHEQAWKMFGKENCEICNKSLKKELQETGKRLSMHNTLDPKNYIVMEKYAWKCLCGKCHWKEEFTKKNNIN